MKNVFIHPTILLVQSRNPPKFTVFQDVSKIIKWRNPKMPKNFIQVDLTPDERLDEITNLFSKAILMRIKRNNDKLDFKNSADRKQGRVIGPLNRKATKFTKRKIHKEELMTIKEVIKFLKISRTTFWRLRKDGTLPCYVVNNSSLSRYKFSDVIRYVRKTKLNNC